MKFEYDGRTVEIEFARCSRGTLLAFQHAQIDGTPKEKAEYGMDLIRESLKNLSDLPLVEEIIDNVVGAYFHILAAAVEACNVNTKKANFEKK